MTREIEILMQAATTVFHSYGIYLSEFRMHLTLDRKYELFLKNTLHTMDAAQEKIKSIATKLPNNFGRLLWVLVSEKGGYTISMPIKLLWELVAKKIPPILLFTDENKRKLGSCEFVYASKLKSQAHNITAQGLQFSNYGWVCTDKRNEEIFESLGIELQTLIWAMYNTGCFYMNIKFDVEPAIFKNVAPPTPMEVGEVCIRCIYPAAMSQNSSTYAKLRF